MGFPGFILMQPDYSVGPKPLMQMGIKNIMGNIKKFVEQFKELDSTKQYAIISKLEEIFEIQANPVLPYKIIELKSEVARLSKENSILKEDIKYTNHRNSILNDELKNIAKTGKYSLIRFEHLWQMLTPEEKKEVIKEVTLNQRYNILLGRVKSLKKHLLLLRSNYDCLLLRYVQKNQ